MTRSKMTLVFLLLIMLVAVSGLLADGEVISEIIVYHGDGDVPLAGYLPPATAGNILIGGTPVLRIPGNGGGVLLAVRAEIVDTRLAEILSSGLVGPVWVGAVRGKPTVYVGEFRLITAYPEDAAATDSTMLDLAWHWALGVAKALIATSPVLSLSPEEIQSEDWDFSSQAMEILGPSKNVESKADYPGWWPDWLKPKSPIIHTPAVMAVRG